LICGVVRNGGAALVHTLQKIQSFERAAENCKVIVVTNDNTDDTDAVLQKWRSLNDRRCVETLDGLAAAIPERVGRIAQARNFYMHAVHREPSEKYKFVIVLDLDGPNTNIVPDDIIGLLQSQTFEWDALFANQHRAFYDVYALRHDTWCPTDCWAEVQAAITFPFRHRKMLKAQSRFVYQRQYHIPPTHPPIAVHSAFGGFAVYKRDALQQCWYGSRDNSGHVICEHVVLNQGIDRRGGKLFIMPALLNDAPEEHLTRDSGRPFPSELHTGADKTARDGS